MQESRVLKSAGRRGCLTEKQETLAPARALRVMAAAQFHRLSGRDPETHRVSPARARRFHKDPCCPHRERPAPAWGAGRALFSMIFAGPVV